MRFKKKSGKITMQTGIKKEIVQYECQLYSSKGKDLLFLYVPCQMLHDITVNVKILLMSQDTIT